MTMYRFQKYLIVSLIIGLVFSVSIPEEKLLFLGSSPLLKAIRKQEIKGLSGTSNLTASEDRIEGSSDAFNPNERVPDKCSKDVNHIENLADMNEIKDCKIITGDIVVTNYKEPIIQFGDIMNIFGNLDIQRASNLVRIEADNVHRIGNTFTLRDLTSLTLISFGSLRYVKIIDWKVLPILNEAHFSNAIKEAESITVSDTSLVEFPGFLTNNLDILDINNNRYLEYIDCNVEKITGRLHIAANSRDVRVSLPKLQSAKNVSIHEVLDLDLSNLEEIESSINIINNLFTHLNLPVLKSIGGTLSLLKNENLGKVEFPNVTEIGGGLMIVNNTKIDKINFFPKLTIIGGAIELMGNIRETNLKNLKLVKGSAKIKSSDPSFDCTKWTKSELSSVIRGGKIECINANNERITADTPIEGGNQDTPEDDDYSIKLTSNADDLHIVAKLKHILLLLTLLITI